MVDPNQKPSAGILPSYKNPPVYEVVCGLRFQTPDEFRIPQIGLLWNRFRSEYPRTQHAPPLTSGPAGVPLLDSATGLPLPRVWFVNESDDQVIQVQPDRFYFNWRRRREKYPRYIHVIANFEKVMQEVKTFFGELRLGEFKPNECDLTYINHIPKGKGWETLADLQKVLRDFLWTPQRERFLPEPNKISWQTEFPLPKDKGFLTIILKQATRTEDKNSLFILELVARGIGVSTDDKGIREWFDLAHEWIVRGFTDLTTDEIQKDIWEREA
jgi:uncharacterized protein (TIGR04255 family)